MRIKLLDKNCMPERKHEDDAGLDLKCRIKFRLEPFQTMTVPSGICVEIPKHFSGDIEPRSSTAKMGCVIQGTVDCGYKGEIGIIITNTTDKPKYFNQYQRIAQLVIKAISEDTTIEVVEDLGESQRGTGGFGSTGIY